MVHIGGMPGSQEFGSTRGSGHGAALPAARARFCRERRRQPGRDLIPRKGGPGITRSDLLVINKTDLAPLVEASLEVMDRDARKMRGERPFVFTNIEKECRCDAHSAVHCQHRRLALTSAPGKPVVGRRR